MKWSGSCLWFCHLKFGLTLPFTFVSHFIHGLRVTPQFRAKDFIAYGFMPWLLQTKVFGIYCSHFFSSAPARLLIELVIEFLRYHLAAGSICCQTNAYICAYIYTPRHTNLLSILRFQFFLESITHTQLSCVLKFCFL